MDDVPHLALPLRVVGGAYQAVQQDTLDEVTTCVACIVGFPLGYRDDRPDFGVRDHALSDRPLDTLDIEQAVEAYEPRATVHVAERPYDARDPLAARLRVEVTLPGAQEVS
jgi:phage baseplate assembly protein W